MSAPSEIADEAASLQKLSTLLAADRFWPTKGIVHFIVSNEGAIGVQISDDEVTATLDPVCKGGAASR